MDESRFHLYLDSADLDELRKCLPHPTVYGVTTNPTLLKRAGVSRAQLSDFTRQCFDLGAQAVQTQVFSATAEEMAADAAALERLGAPGQIVIKIPVTREGLKAGARLIGEGVPVTFTAVYVLEQALFAAQLGAAYAAPYLGRLDDSGVDGLGLIQKMQAVVMRETQVTRLLVASIRSRAAFLGLMELGVGAMTVPPKLFHELLDHETTLSAEAAFLADAAALGD
ncbi:MAG TPA: transaldolase family protein [Dongiaceae bacterium]|nr:transaldolase family protein [Dongiaceae bacterium]